MAEEKNDLKRVYVRETICYEVVTYYLDKNWEVVEERLLDKERAYKIKEELDKTYKKG